MIVKPTKVFPLYGGRFLSKEKSEYSLLRLLREQAAKEEAQDRVIPFLHRRNENRDRDIEIDYR
jgi:hypothetical protein